MKKSLYARFKGMNKSLHARFKGMNKSLYARFKGIRTALDFHPIQEATNETSTTNISKNMKSLKFSNVY